MKNLFYMSIVSALFFTGCGKGACCEQNINEPLGQSKVVGAVDDPNITPVARITSLPQRTNDCNGADANGEKSSDEDGNITAYSWSVDNVQVSTQSSVTGILPCENSKETYNVCLEVTDNEGATGSTCQEVEIKTSDIDDVNDTVDPQHAVTPIIQLPSPYRSGDDFIFDACGIQDFSPHVVKDETTDAQTTGYLWNVTRHFEDNTTRSHQFYACKKYIDWSKDSNKFVKLDVSLTVRFTDGHENTTTSSYFPNEDASDLDIIE